MARRGVNRIPIVRDGALVGIVARADVVALFDRPTDSLLDDVRRTIRNSACLDPDQFGVSVEDGVVHVFGEVAEPYDIGTLERYLNEIDGLTAVDVSGVSVRSPTPTRS
jgi:signal-transduction protein with cAMP-binding, CBS, and nucleotidyltransferase domain